MALRIGDTAPDFEAESTEGRIRFHDWIGDSWAVLFSHPKDFTPVCTTELGYMARIKPEFDKRGVKIIGLSVDPIGGHDGLGDRHRGDAGRRPNYPIIADPDFRSRRSTGCCRRATSGDPKERTPADNQTVRNVFVIGPDKKVKLILVYPMTTGRNFDEVLRVIDSLQLTAKHKVATPVNWKQGEDVIIAGSVSDDQAKELAGRVGVAEAVHPDRPGARREVLTGNLAEGDRLGALPEGEASQLLQVVLSLDERGEVVGPELPRLAREVAVAVREEQLGLALAAGVEGDLAGVRVLRRGSPARCRGRGRPTGSSSTLRSSGSG